MDTSTTDTRTDYTQPMNSSAPERVAIVTVHGVADQQPGQTVRELARLLCHGADGPPRYGEGETHGVLIPVTPLPAHAAHAAPAAPAQTPVKAAGARLPQPGAPSDFYRSEATRPAASAAAPRGQAARTAEDLGITLTDYLLSRYQPAERDALYESTRIALKRRSDGLPVDLFELYWADYSRLQPGGARAFSATYQLLFHLGTLARDVIDQVALAAHARAAPRAWSLMQLLHAWSAWLMRAPAALLQMAMGLLFVFGMAAIVPDEQQQLVLSAFAGAASAVLGGMALLAWLRPPAARERGKALGCAAAAVASAAVAVAAIAAPQGFPWLYLGTAALGTGALGMALVWRFGLVARDVKTVGALVMTALVALLFLRGRINLGHATTQVQWMLDSALNTGEYLLAALLLVWSALVVTQIVALCLGFVLAHGAQPAVRESIVTARLGMILSTALFALLSLLFWSVLSYLANFALDDLYYTPVFSAGGYPAASIFLENQVKAVGTLFTPLVLSAAVLGGIAVLALAPALREELVPTANLAGGQPSAAAAQWSVRLGDWLSRVRRILRSLFSWFVPLLAIAGGLLFLAFMLQRLFELPPLLSWLDADQGVTLVAAGKWLAGGAVTVTALGARFTQTFGKLRVALDAILDVDNYFRDPLDRRPPRARIFSRFTALLAHLRERGYARIVVVSHSQGTVISADLLRYLQRDGRLPALLGEVPVALVTLGSPLRELYALRFPLLYTWVGPAQAFAGATPAVDELGIAQWVNAYRAGDYVGRELWTPRDDPRAFAVAATAADGTVTAQRAAGRTEFCLGAGAHTHYFSNDAVALAAEIDRLVTTPGAPLR